MLTHRLAHLAESSKTCPRYWPQAQNFLLAVPESGSNLAGSGERLHHRTCRQTCPVVYPTAIHTSQKSFVIADRIHLHLLSDSTGETLEMLA